MAPKLSSFSIVLVLVMLVSSQVLARELMKKKEDGKDFDLGITDDYPRLPPNPLPNTSPFGRGPPPESCEMCGDECCPDAEYSESGKKVGVDKADRFNGDEHEGHGVAGAGHGSNGGGRS